MIDTVFITGTGRSGTNLLKDIFSNHSDVASLPFESRYTVDPDGVFDFLRSYTSWSPFLANKKINRLTDLLKSLAHRNEATYDNEDVNVKEPYADWELNKWIPGYYDSVLQLETELCTFTYEARYPGSNTHEVHTMDYYSYQKEIVEKVLKNFLENCNEAIRKDKDCKLLIEDNTWSFIYSNEIMRLLPNSMLIFMMRDPRDVISSMKNQRWTPNNTSDLITYYSDLMKVWEEQKQKISEQSYMEIRFEDLIADSNEVLRLICRAINLDFEEGMLDQDMSKSNIGRYVRDLQQEEIEMIEVALKDTLEKYEYV
ncbi:MAG: sulfotransferase [Bacteroidota bacterium]